MRDEPLLGRCLVEGDPESTKRLRRARRKALALSLGIEAAAVALVILLPFLGVQALPQRVLLTPSPPYPGSPLSSVHRPPGSSSASIPKRNNIPNVFLAPPRIPATVERKADSAESEEGLGRAVGPEGLGISSGILPPLGPSSGWLAKPPEPPKPHEARQRVVHSEGLQQALLVHRVMPGYPPAALQARLEGTVVLHAIIARDGGVRELEIVSGSPIFALAAREAVLGWRYRPTLLNGEPVEVETTITVIFQLAR